MIMQDSITGGPEGGAPAIPLAPDPQAGGSTPGGARASAGQAASSLADQAKDKLTGALDGQKGAAADMIEKLAGTVQRSGEQFQGQQDWIASAIRRGATELNTLAGSLRDKDIGDLAREVQSFAKAQPALFIGAALAAGFAVARLGKVVAGDLSRDDLPSMPEVAHGQH
jgi:hypothetical protein